MSTPASTWRRIADAFTARVEGVAPDGWDRPAPCDGWVARDIVGHLTTWVPAFLQAGAGLDLEPGPDADADPAGAWHHLDQAVRRVLDDPEVGTSQFEHPQAGTHPLDQAIERFVTGDVLVHTWDLARATGQDEALDPDFAAGMLAGMEPMAEVLAASGHYGPQVPVPDDADVQTRLIALTGRQP